MTRQTPMLQILPYSTALTISPGDIVLPYDTAVPSPQGCMPEPGKSQAEHNTADQFHQA